MLLGRLVQAHLRHGTVGVYWKHELHTAVFDCATLHGNINMFAVYQIHLCLIFSLSFIFNAFRAEEILISYCINTAKYCTKPIFCGIDEITV